MIARGIHRPGGQIGEELAATRTLRLARGQVRGRAPPMVNGHSHPPPPQYATAPPPASASYDWQQPPYAPAPVHSQGPPPPQPQYGMATAPPQPPPSVPQYVPPPPPQQQQQAPQPAVPIMAPHHLFHFQGISAADAMRRSGGHLGPEAFGFVQQRCALSSYSNSKKNRNNNKAPWTKEEDEEVQNVPV